MGAFLVILDLDAATTDSISGDHEQVTIPFLAAEIISFKLSATQRYGKSGEIGGLAPYLPWRVVRGMEYE